ncbi:MAG TPA: formate--tetrahydrofolate ligase [Candidatus Limnocylindria bacterium]|jgi:formate--tetrahydrofolate ligase|nr:formate--tetrahydrofolate ligase [Candidatus Limnocylindria bacterium]
MTTSPAARPASPRDAGAPRPIIRVADELGLLADEVELHGRLLAKVSLSALARLADAPLGRLVLVTAMTPTPLGEGKTTTAIGLADGLATLGLRSIVTLRQPTLGPVFGLKGGAAGAGRASLVPRQEVNLHLTGDAYAVGAAHNLAAAVLDAHLYHGNGLGIDPATITWPRVTDHNDRALRRARIAIGDAGERDATWEITSASEVMAILALASGIVDLRRRLGRIVVAHRFDGRPVTLDDLRVAGAMAALLRDALRPTLLQTAEGTPAFVHAGPFANIAHGTSSILADRLALRLADVVVTEAGFAAELGAEKFFDIKCRVGGLRAAVAVVVATTRALERHGAENLAQHVATVHRFGVPCAVALNVFPGDTPEQVAAALTAAREAGAEAAHATRHVASGAAGARRLAEAVADLSLRPSTPELLYPDDLPLRAKVERIATQLYGADGVDWAPQALRALDGLQADGHGTLPVCIAKTPLSLSHDPKRTGRPRAYRMPVRRVRLFAGAGFVTVYAGAVQTLPGLPADPAAARVELEPDGTIVGV